MKPSFFLAAAIFSLALGCSQSGKEIITFGNPEGTSTGSGTPQEGGDTDSKPEIDVSKYGYPELKEKIFDKYCNSCHTGKKDPSLATYQEYVANLADVMKEVVVEKKMPKGAKRGEPGPKLSAFEIRMVKSWIDRGAPELSQVPKEPEVPVEVVTWDKLNKEIFANKCNNCHFTGNKDGISSFEDGDQVRATVGSIYLTTVIAPVMPPPPAGTEEGALNTNQLTRKEKEMINAWIIDGMK